MVLPARHRERFIERSGDSIIVTADRSGECLLLYPLADWEPVERALVALPTTDPEAQLLQRILLGHATEVPLDGHGRILLTPELREFAGLQRQAMLLGLGRKCELWDEARWFDRRATWVKEKPDPAGRSTQLGSLSY